MPWKIRLLATLGLPLGAAGWYLAIMNCYDLPELLAWCRRHGIQRNDLRRMRYFLLRMYEPPHRALAKFPPSVPDLAKRELDWDLLQVVSRRDSLQDGSTKLLLTARDGERLETVIIRARTGRTTVCLSSQAGCAAGCHFCATAALGLRRSLAAAEILEQVRLAGQIVRQEGRQLRNVVFMGMGEPLDNRQPLQHAIEQITAQDGFAIPARRIMISTVGIPQAMQTFVDQNPHVQIAVSLHSADPNVRGRLIPWSRHVDWRELQQAIRYVAMRHVDRPQQGPLMIEYLMLDRVNDSPSDAEQLIAYLEGIPAHINLIPYNPIANRPQWRASPREVRDRFCQQLRQAGFFTTVRFSMGSDIDAACGQLALQS